MASSKRKTMSTTPNPKKAKKDLAPLHPAQLAVAARVQATMARREPDTDEGEALGGAYLVAPAGMGKSTLLRATLQPCDKEAVVLNIVAVPSAPLAEEMRSKMHFTFAPPFNGSKVDSLRSAVVAAKEGDVLTIA
eukprot:5933020-Prymnesium_polylepis.1